jgi:hypothetical protein
MAQKNPKVKMVSFRLSSAEYEAALATCRAHGFRSLSMLARSAFLAFSPAQSAQSVSYDKELMEIRQRIEYLTGELNRLAIIVGSPSGQGSAAPATQDQKSHSATDVRTGVLP